MFKTTFLFFAVIFLANGAKKIPDWVTLCKRSDPNLNDCYVKSFTNVMTRIHKPLPEMNLRAYDPLEIEKLNLDFGTGTSVAFNAEMYNVSVYGALDGTLRSVNIDLDKLIFDSELDFPDIKMSGLFKAKGKVLLLQFDTDGLMTANLTNVNVKGRWLAEKYQKKGRTHIRFISSDIKPTFGSIETYFTNIFPNNPEITANTNRAINDNIDVLYEEIKPLFLQIVKTFVQDALNNVYNTFSIDELYPS